MLMQQRPILTIAKAAELSATTFPTASGALANLESLGLIKEISGRRRGRIYAYQAYLDILNEGAEPLPR